MGSIEDRLGKLGEAGFQFVLLSGTVIISDSHARTIYIYVIYAKTCGIKTSLPDAALCSKSFAEECCSAQRTAFLLPAIGAGAYDMETAIHHGSAQESIILCFFEVFLQQRLAVTGNLKVIKICFLRSITVVIILTEAEIAIGKFACAGIHLLTVHKSCGGSSIPDLNTESVYLTILDINSQGVLRHTGCSTVLPAMRTKTWRTGQGVNLPHIVIVVILGRKDKAGSQLSDLEFHLNLVVLDNSNRSTALRRTGTFYPFGTIPCRSVFQTNLEISPLCAGGCISLVVGNRNLPIISGAGLGRETRCLHIRRLVALYRS